MGKQYDDPRFGVEQVVVLPATGALNGTVGATVLRRYRVKKNMAINAVYANFVAGGTDAVRQILIGTCVAGGTPAYIGTATLGTQADDSTKDLSISGNVDNGDEIIISHLGTGAQPFNVELGLFLQERFVDE